MRVFEKTAKILLDDKQNLCGISKKTHKFFVERICLQYKKYYATISSQIFKKLKEDVTIYENQKSFSTYYGYLP